MRILLSLLLVPVAAVAGERGDYARQWALATSQDAAGAYRVVLDEAVYRSAVDPALRDIEVFNANGESLPAAVFAADQPQAQAPRTRPLSWFALPPSAATGGADLRLIAERDGAGRVQRIEATVASAPAAAGTQWLVDASVLGEAPRALLVEWPDAAAPFELAYRVDGSDDLRSWRTLNSGTPLLDLRRDGERLQQRRIPLNGQARYLRLLPARAGQASLALEGVRAELAPATAAVDWQWQTLRGQRRVENGKPVFEFELPGRFPVTRTDVRLPGNNALEWTLHSRESRDAAWAWRAGPWMAYQVGQDGHSEPRGLNAAVRDRYWRLTPATAVGAEVPELRLGYRGEVLVFLVQGEAPYALAAGSGRAARADAPIASLLDALRRQHGEGWQPASATLATAPEELAGEAALSPGPMQRDWTHLLLWALLVLGAVLVAGFGLSLLRQRPSGG